MATIKSAQDFLGGKGFTVLTRNDPIDQDAAEEQKKSGYMSKVADAAKSGVEQVISGAKDIAKGTPVSVLEGGLRAGAGAINAVTSPIAPLFSPIQKGIEAVGDAVGSIPEVQQFANSKAGEVTERVAEDVANASVIAGSVTGVKGLPRAAAAAKGAASAGADLAAATANKVRSVLPGGKAISSSILERQSRLSPGKRIEFKDMTGKTVGEYLTENGYTGTQDRVLAQLANKFAESYKAKRAALETAPPEKTYRTPAVSSAIKELVQRAEETSAPGAPSPILEKARQYESLYKSRGLKLIEEDDVKALFEREVKLGYKKDQNNIGVERSTNIDDQLRKSIEKKAESLGIKGIAEQNAITRNNMWLMQEIADAHNGRGANNMFGLTDTIIASNIPATPEAAAMLLGKKVVSSDMVLGNIARATAGKPKDQLVAVSTKPATPVADLGSGKVQKVAPVAVQEKAATGSTEVASLEAAAQQAATDAPLSPFAGLSKEDKAAIKGAAKEAEKAAKEKAQYEKAYLKELDDMKDEAPPAVIVDEIMKSGIKIIQHERRDGIEGLQGRYAVVYRKNAKLGIDQWTQLYNDTYGADLSTSEFRDLIVDEFDRRKKKGKN